MNTLKAINGVLRERKLGMTQELNWNIKESPSEGKIYKLNPENE